MDRFIMVDLAEIKGEILTEVNVSERNDEIIFVCESGKQFKMFHVQDCCEHVTVDDICGDLSDLLGSPILVAEENKSQDEPARDEYDESYTWTFYKLATEKGYVDIKWYGTSNGYYCESVDFARIK